MEHISLQTALLKATQHQLSLQHPDGYWWYTLEATEYICAESIFLAHFMDVVDHKTELGLIRRILSRQRADGTWALYYNAEADLSTTIESYLALKLALNNPRLFTDLKQKIEHSMVLAKDYILAAGGIAKSRVFTKIHLAMHGLVPWNACPAMPIELILMPTWAPVNIYEFSSWARACIVPLLVVLNEKPVRKFFKGAADFNLEELFSEKENERDWNYKTNKFFISWENLFIKLNKFLKVAEYLPIRPFEEKAEKKCEEWICDHIKRTEDIYPALAYGAMALSVMGHSNEHPIIKKALLALKNFQQIYTGPDLPANACETQTGSQDGAVHQQCCISPVWDTPWQVTALLEAGLPADHPSLLKAGRWLISKQIKDTYGDWRFKNPGVKPGGWSFEFENDFFPDVDDTIQVLNVLDRLALPENEKGPSKELGLKWLVSMQNDDGGFAAFDKNNNLDIVNKIPFSDHGACLDDSSPDITGRVLALLCDEHEGKYSEAIEKCIAYLKRTQENFGAWRARWGINYSYGSWCAITGLSRCNGGGNDVKAMIDKAASWLKSIQHDDGGWSESPETYRDNKYIPYPRNDGRPQGVASQTAWALMGLINAGEGDSKEAAKGIEYLIENLRQDGTWDEKEFTGTGFPNHFYIRYHGYRHFFPLMALGMARTRL